MMQFATRAEAIYRQIIEEINGSGETTDKYDTDAIAYEVLGGPEDGWMLKPEYGGLTGDPKRDVDAEYYAERFWDVVETHAR